MKIGTYYYPEQWPRQQWERDFDNIVAMGLQIVHIGEFAWFSMEPQPGKFEFDWLDECVELAAKRKLAVILCTPTAAPPVWLIDQHPDVLPTDYHGTRGRFGGRRHYTPTSAALHEATTRIVTALADRYGSHPSVIGWQIDNEYCGEFDQSDQTHRAFRQWLSQKYESIDNLNRAWGNQFWNTYYTSFDQVLMPRDRDPRYANPHHHLDASRFWSSAYASFNKLQHDILGPRVGERFITTNFMPFQLECNPADFTDSLSLFSWDAYPITGWVKNPPDNTYRMADPAWMGFYNDLMRSYTGRWGLLEIQPGQVNWSGVPVLLYPGAVRLWLWTAIAHGAEFITVYRFRQPRFGIELFHHGLVTHDGVTPSPGGRQFSQVIDELKRVETRSTATKGTPEPPAATAKPARGLGRSRRAASANPAPSPSTTQLGEARVALLFDFDQLWYYATLPQAKRWNQPDWITTWYGSLCRLGLPIDIYHPDRPWPGNPSILVVPGLQMIDTALVAKLDEYASLGGNLLLTCRTGTMDKHGQVFEAPTAGPILPLIGGTIEAYDGLPEDTWGAVELDGQKHLWGPWGELLYAEEPTRVVARYADQFYAGAAAVLQRKHGIGSVTYCGVYAQSTLTDALIERIALAGKVPSMHLPPRTQLLRRDDHWIFLNYQDATVQAPAPAGAEFIVGDRTVDPAAVAIWRA